MRHSEACIQYRKNLVWAAYMSVPVEPAPACPVCDDPNRTAQLENSKEVLKSVHPKDSCAGDYCPIHNRSNHHMRKFPQHWRADRGIIERICPHGIGHPDPDQSAFFKKVYGKDAWAQWVHGCDGCCR